MIKCVVNAESGFKDLKANKYYVKNSEIELKKERFDMANKYGDILREIPAKGKNISTESGKLKSSGEN